MHVKNFLEVGAKLASSKADAKRLQKQLEDEAKRHADNVEMNHGQLQFANDRLKKLAIGARSLDRAESVLTAMKGRC